MVTTAGGEKTKSATLEFLCIGSDEIAVRRTQTVLGGKGLMPIWIEQRRAAHGVQSCPLFGAQHKTCRCDIVAELLFIAPSNDRRGDAGAPQQPAQRDLRTRHAAVL